MIARHLHTQKSFWEFRHAGGHCSHEGQVHWTPQGLRVYQVRGCNRCVQKVFFFLAVWPQKSSQRREAGVYFRAYPPSSCVQLVVLQTTHLRCSGGATRYLLLLIYIYIFHHHTCCFVPTERSVKYCDNRLNPDGCVASPYVPFCHALRLHRGIVSPIYHQDHPSPKMPPARVP